MLLTGVGLAALTLPLVGWQTWRDWLEVGQLASDNYARDRGWIFLSRDLQGIPRRWLLESGDTTSTPPARRTLATVLGLGLWLAAVAVTVAVAWRRRRGPAPLAGPGAAFVLLGAWLSCYHFMYYDVLLAGLPMCLLFVPPRGVPRARRVVDKFPYTLLAILIPLPFLSVLLDPTHHYPPGDTFCLLALWAWCGWKWLRTPEEVPELLAVRGP
jgi:hypothetical protein